MRNFDIYNYLWWRWYVTGISSKSLFILMLLTTAECFLTWRSFQTWAPKKLNRSGRTNTWSMFGDVRGSHYESPNSQKSWRGLPILTQDTKASAAMVPVYSHGTALPPPRATTLAHRVALIHPKKERVGPKGVRTWLTPLACVLCLACAPGQRCNPLKVGARMQNDHKARNQQEEFSIFIYFLLVGLACLGWLQPSLGYLWRHWRKHGLYQNSPATARFKAC